MLSAAQIRRRREDVQHRHRRHRYELWHDLARQPNEGVERHLDLVPHRVLDRSAKILNKFQI